MLVSVDDNRASTSRNNRTQTMMSMDRLSRRKRERDNHHNNNNRRLNNEISRKKQQKYCLYTYLHLQHFVCVSAFNMAN